FLAVVPGVAAAAQGTAILYGSVTDSLGQPLRATVGVAASPAMAVADGGGRYRLAVPAGRVIARAGHIGFRSQVDTTTIAAGDSLERDYRLGAFPVELQATIVTAAKHSQLLDESATSVAVMNSTDLARPALATGHEAVSLAPGARCLNGQLNIPSSTGS